MGPEERAYSLAFISLAGFALSALLAAACNGPIAGIGTLAFSLDLADFGRWPQPVPLWFAARAVYLASIWCGFHGLYLSPRRPSGPLQLAGGLSLLAVALGVLGFMLFPRLAH
jgi:hypothetical protein